MSEASTELVFITALVTLPLISAVVLFTRLPATGEVSGLLLSRLRSGGRPGAA